MRATSTICTKGLRKRNKFSPRQRVQKLWRTLAEAEKKGIGEALLKINKWEDVRQSSPMPHQPLPVKPEVRLVDSGLGKRIPFLRWMLLLMLTVLVGIVFMRFAPDLVWWTLVVPVLGGMYLFVSEDIAYRRKHYKFF